MHLHIFKAYLADRQALWEASTSFGDLVTASGSIHVGINIHKRPTCNTCRSNKVKNLLLLLVCLPTFGQLSTTTLQIHSKDIQLDQR